MWGSLRDVGGSSLGDIDAEIFKQLGAVLWKVSNFSFSQHVHTLEFSVICVVVLIVAGLQVKIASTAV